MISLVLCHYYYRKNISTHVPLQSKDSAERVHMFLFRLDPVIILVNMVWVCLQAMLLQTQTLREPPN